MGPARVADKRLVSGGRLEREGETRYVSPGAEVYSPLILT